MSYKISATLAVDKNNRMAYNGGSFPEGHLGIINRYLASMGKAAVDESQILVRPLRLTGNQLTSIGTRFKAADMYQLASKMQGVAMLIGHDTEDAPIATFYTAQITPENDNLWLDTWFFTTNDSDGQSLVAKIDTGVYNEASIGWLYTLAECSICNRDYFGAMWAKYFMTVEEAEAEDLCGHLIGQEYNKKKCFIWTTGELTPIEGSIVFKGAHPGTKVGGFGFASFKPIDLLSNKARYHVSASVSGITLSESEVIDFSKLPTESLVRKLREEWKLGEDVSLDKLKNATRMLVQLSIPDSHMEAVKASLSLDFESLGYEIPWAESEKWQSFQRLSDELAKGYVNDSSIDEYKKLQMELFKKKEEEQMKLEFTLKLGQQDQVISAETTEELVSSIGAAYDKYVQDTVASKEAELAQTVDSLKVQLQTANETLSEISQKAKEAEEKSEQLSVALEGLKAKTTIAETYLSELADEAVSLRISLDGAQAAEAYERVVKAWAASDDVVSLKTEVDRLRALKNEKFPSGRLSQTSGNDSFVSHPKLIAQYQL